MTLFLILSCFTGGLGALTLAIVLLWRKREGYVLRALTGVMATVALIQFSNGLTFLNADRPMLWRQIALVGELGLPTSLGFFCVTLLKKISGAVEKTDIWRWRIVLILAATISLLVIGFPNLFIRQFSNNGDVVFTRPWGGLLWGFVLLTLVLALSQLEHILRVSRDPLRYQLKFILIGLGGIAGYDIAQSAQMLMLSTWKPHYALASGMATLICIGLIAFGLGRWRIQDLSQKLYLSPQVLYTSFTFLIVGSYLIGIGVLAPILQRTEWALSHAIGMLIFFTATLVLVVVLFSRKARAEFQVFLSRHFYRSKYDYRLKWLELTEEFSSCQSADGILDQFLNILSRTFGASHITIWRKFEADNCFHQVRSVNTIQTPNPLSQTHPIVKLLSETGEPFDFSDSTVEPNEEIRMFSQATKAVACVPLEGFSNNLVGFVTLSQELQNRSYGKDDFDLLRAMAHHVTMLLTQVELMEDRTAAAEWEALHRFSAYYVHDLKNLASGLSLVVQNAKEYGTDPEFQTSAWRTIGKTGERMMGLINRLSIQSKGSGERLDHSFQQANINEVVSEIVASFDGAPGSLKFVAGTELPPVSLLLQPFKEVLLNVIVNARQALNTPGTIEIKTHRDGDWALLSVNDNGGGIPSSQLSSIFKPFRSTKKGGMGIGLYQCKRIIEQHGGKIHVTSREGEGTQIMIALPLGEENGSLP